MNVLAGTTVLRFGIELAIYRRIRFTLKFSRNLRVSLRAKLQSNDKDKRLLSTIKKQDFSV